MEYLCVWTSGFPFQQPKALRFGAFNEGEMHKQPSENANNNNNDNFLSVIFYLNRQNIMPYSAILKIDAKLIITLY